jgi:hypothetical protein
MMRDRFAWAVARLLGRSCVTRGTTMVSVAATREIGSPIWLFAQPS